MKRPFFNNDVKAIFEKYPPYIQKRFMEIRALVFQVAAGCKEVGALTETVRWGQISYLTQASKSGSLVRIDVYRPLVNKLALFFHCQTSLIAEFRQQFPNAFGYESSRALIIDAISPYDQNALQVCIQRALTYKLPQNH